MIRFINTLILAALVLAAIPFMMLDSWLEWKEIQRRAKRARP